MIVDDALIELLAIKLYEHAFDRYPPVTLLPWSQCAEASREIFRQMACGESAYGSGPDDVKEIDP